MGEVARAGTVATTTPGAAIFWPAEGGRLGFEWPPPRGIMGVVERPTGAASGDMGAMFGEGGAGMPPGGSLRPSRRRTREQSSPALGRGAGWPCRPAFPALGLAAARGPSAGAVAGMLGGANDRRAEGGTAAAAAGPGAPARPGALSSCGCLLAEMLWGLRKNRSTAVFRSVLGATRSTSARCAAVRGSKAWPVASEPLNSLRLPLAALLAPVPCRGTLFPAAGSPPPAPGRRRRGMCSEWELPCLETTWPQPHWVLPPKHGEGRAVAAGGWWEEPLPGVDGG